MAMLCINVIDCLIRCSFLTSITSFVNHRLLFETIYRHLPPNRSSINWYERLETLIDQIIKQRYEIVNVNGTKFAKQIEIVTDINYSRWNTRIQHNLLLTSRLHSIFLVETYLKRDVLDLCAIQLAYAIKKEYSGKQYNSNFDITYDRNIYTQLVCRAVARSNQIDWGCRQRLNEEKPCRKHVDDDNEVTYA